MCMFHFVLVCQLLPCLFSLPFNEGIQESFQADATVMKEDTKMDKKRKTWLPWQGTYIDNR
eukprot:m.108055 g.108055  ORF g.108055 m.108055 type:complete len:61 (-) comp9184_c8_seq1:1689-1871(-)